ncbi:hypothetical protein GF420_08550 [candidate division GN15 bacterium]|nr:hypothetical protein [candidate division GN15 bacterium]
MKTSLTSVTIALVLALVFLPGILFSEEPVLNKVLYELDDLYYAAISDRNLDDIELLRDAMLVDREGDTLWVGVFITTTASDTLIARKTFDSMKLRTLVQFDNLFSARVRLQQLPELDRLDFVKSIAPASSRGHTASSIFWQDFPAENATKKKRFD